MAPYRFCNTLVEESRVSWVHFLQVILRSMKALPIRDRVEHTMQCLTAFREKSQKGKLPNRIPQGYDLSECARCEQQKVQRSKEGLRGIKTSWGTKNSQLHIQLHANITGKRKGRVWDVNVGMVQTLQHDFNFLELRNSLNHCFKHQVSRLYYQVSVNQQLVCRAQMFRIVEYECSDSHDFLPQRRATSSGSVF